MKIPICIEWTQARLISALSESNKQQAWERLFRELRFVINLSFTRNKFTFFLSPPLAHHVDNNDKIKNAYGSILKIKLKCRQAVFAKSRPRYTDDMIKMQMEVVVATMDVHKRLLTTKKLKNVIGDSSYG